MSRRSDTPRDLMLGLLALQTGLIDSSELILAFHGWSRAEGRPMAEILVERGALDGDQRGLLEALAAQHLKKHGGNVAKSLASIGVGPSTRKKLAEVANPDLGDSLATVGVAVTDEDDPYATASRPIGTSTSGGQRFRVLRPHARGGLGAVFVALDAELNREVALKEILEHHADNPAHQAKFLIEAEITGNLEHPGIVPVYGLGHYDDGRPYYAMRFIKGDNLKQAIERFHADEGLKASPGARSLALRNLLRRFSDVCNAIEYAHSRGVLHRDIKPGNVIIGKHGETLVVDWGLAKAGGNDGTELIEGEKSLIPATAGGSAQTLPGHAIGTPAYMSPEQALGDLDRLGPRSDVYSLGATLYSLLTGRPPFSGEIGIVLQDVVKGRFPRPRSIDPAIDPALEALCLKAMANSPGDRYRSPRALADDLERWSADEPVSAYTEPFTRKARRWARRNRTIVTAALVALPVAMVGLTGVLAVQARASGNMTLKNIELTLANRREIGVNAELRAAKDQVESKNALLATANEQVQTRFDLAQEAIQTFQTTVNEDLILKNPNFLELRNRLLRSAANFYAKLAALLEGQSDRRSRIALSRSYYQLGRLTTSIGVMTEAIQVHQRALQVRRELALSAGSGDEEHLDIARSLVEIGDIERSTGALDAAMVLYSEARDLTDRIRIAGREAQASMELLGVCHDGIGYLWFDKNRIDEAIAQFSRALQIRQEIAEGRPGDERIQGQIAASHHNLANQLSDLGRATLAMDSYRQAEVIRLRLVRSSPIDPQRQADLASTYHGISILFRETGRFEESLAVRIRALKIREKLCEDHRAVKQFSADLAACFNNIGILNRDVGKAAEALEAFEKSRTLAEALVAADPSMIPYREHLSSALLGMAGSNANLGRAEKAVEQTRQAIRIVAGFDPTADNFYNLACGYAILVGAGSLPGSGMPPGELERAGGLATDALKEAIAAGFLGSSLLKLDPDLGPIRHRPEFRSLQLDLEFPADPFAVSP